MADNTSEQEKRESTIDQISEKFDPSDSSSASAKTKIHRLFGREKPVHTVLGGGKLADIFLWRDKKVSAGLLGFATTVWVLFELLEYHLLTVVCHVLIFGLSIVFLWSNTSTFINKSRPQIPEVVIPEDVILSIASSLRVEINRGLASFRDAAYGISLKKFLAIIANLWAVAALADWFNFLSLFYMSLVLLFTVPVFYETYEDKIEAFAKAAEAEFENQYAVFNARVLGRVPKPSFKDKFA